MKDGDLVWVVDENLVVQQAKVGLRNQTQACLVMGSQLVVMPLEKCLTNREKALETALLLSNQDRMKKASQNQQGVPR